MAVIEADRAGAGESDLGGPRTVGGGAGSLGLVAGVELSGPIDAWAQAQVVLTAEVGRWLVSRAWEADGSRSPVAWLVHHAGLHSRAAGRLVKRARLLNRLGVMERLVEGRLSLAQADVLADAIGRDQLHLAVEHVELLMELAERIDHVEDFARVVGQWRQRADDVVGARDSQARHDSRRLIAAPTLFGDLILEGRFGPEDASVILRALEAYRSADPVEVKRSPLQRRADALVDACAAALAPLEPDPPGGGDGADPASDDLHRPAPATSSPTAESPLASGSPRGRRRRAVGGWSGGARFEPLVILDLGALDGDPVSEISFDAAPIGRRALDRLICEHRLAVASGTSTNQHLGRSQRLPSPSQRMAVRARDRYCAFPLCRVPHPVCQIHHLTPWHRGGPTDIDNLTLLCRHHHRLVHEGGWVLTGTAGAALTAIGPDGRRLTEPDQRARRSPERTPARQSEHSSARSLDPPPV